MKNVRKDNKARKAGKAGKAGKTGKAKLTGSIFNKRKSVAVSSHDGQVRSIKPSESAGTPSISGQLLLININQSPQKRFRVCFFK